jgi:hypothetical protein
MVNNATANSFMLNSTETFAERRERLRQVLSSPIDNPNITGLNLWRGGKRPEQESPKATEPTEALFAPTIKPAMQSASLAASFYVAGSEVENTLTDVVHTSPYRTTRLSLNSHIINITSIIFPALEEKFANIHRRGGQFSENDFRDMLQFTMDTIRNAYLAEADTHGLPKGFGTEKFESEILSRAFSLLLMQNQSGALVAANGTGGMNTDGVGADWQFFSARHWFQEFEVRGLMINFAENFAREKGLDCPVQMYRNNEYLAPLLTEKMRPPFDFPEDFTPDRNFTMLHDKRNNLLRINGTRVCLTQAGRMNTVDELRRFLDDLGVDFGLFSAVRFLSNHFNMMTRGHNLHLEWLHGQAHQAYDSFSLSE